MTYINTVYLYGVLLELDTLILIYYELSVVLM